MSPIQYARAILKAVELHEGSYDQVASDAAAKLDLVYVDYSKFYGIDLETACEEACKLENICVSMARLMYLALDGWWNDTLDWAWRVTDPRGTVPPTQHRCQHGVLYELLNQDDASCTMCNARRLEQEANYAVS